MTIYDNDWLTIREHFSDAEKAIIASTVMCETIVPPGVIVDKSKMSEALAYRLTMLLGSRTTN
jgi:hypothetical protein